MPRYALISVTDKRDVVDFARGLLELGFTILSTGGTHRSIRDGGLPAREVSEYTGFPELMDGRVKTLHPKVHGGILGRRGVDDAIMSSHGIERIDLVVVNLYRFRETTRKLGVSEAEIVENIDIGGPAMIRSAAKNHASVAVVVDPADYREVIEQLHAGNGTVSNQFARRLAAKAFAHTAAYDCAVASWFDAPTIEQGERRAFGPSFALVGDKLADLRYGENPHQYAALYRDPDSFGPSLAAARQLLGKELSFNNLLDLDAALGLAIEFDAASCVIVKHNNPCGTATADGPAVAFRRALAADPQSAFGGIVAFNRDLDATTARAIVEDGNFVEAIVAPTVSADACAILGEARWGKNVRVLALGGVPDASRPRATVRPISGGFLVQSADVRAELPELTCVTKRQPSDAEQRALTFAWRVCKHVKSNAIVLARTDGEARVTVGVGAGQMSRVDSVEIALEKAGELARGAVLASDAFFPFADGIEAAIRAGVCAVIQPGGSKRDAEVIDAADRAKVAMVFTGRRHFRH